MVSLVIYGIIAIALASAAGYALLNVVRTTNQTNYTQENAVRMETAAAAIRATLIAISPGTYGGVVFAPMGATIYDPSYPTVPYTGLPTVLGAVGSTPWGQPYLYCPVALANASALPGALPVLVQSPDGKSYQVYQYTGANTGGGTQNGVNYVVANGTPAPPMTGFTNTSFQMSYVAFIVSSIGPGGGPVPSCDQITISSTGVTVSGGTVRGITAGFAFDQRVVASSDRTELYVAAKPTGDSSGRDANNLTTLDYALNLWAALQPRLTDIYIADGGNLKVDSDLNVLDTRPWADGETTSLVIATMPGAPGQGTLVFTAPVTINSNTEFQNVIISTNYPLTALKPLVLNDVTYNGGGSSQPAISMYGTTLMSNDSTFSNVQIEPNNSTVEFYNRATGSPAYTFGNTQIIGSLSTISFDASFDPVANALTTPTYTLQGNGTVIPIQLTASTLNVGTTVTLTEALRGSYGMSLLNSKINVAGSLSMTGNNVPFGIYGTDNSAVAVTGSISITVGGTSGYGIYLSGSQFGLDGTLTTSGLTYGAVGLSQSAFSGGNTKAIIHTGANNIACLRLLQGLADNTWNYGSTGVNIPLFISPTTVVSDPGGSTDWSQNFPSFAEAALGLPPMVNYFNNLDIGGGSPSQYPGAELTAAGRLGNAYSTPNTPNNDAVVDSMVVINPSAPSATQIPANTLIGYVDPTTLERSVRNLVNADFVTGANINFPGTCVTP